MFSAAPNQNVHFAVKVVTNALDEQQNKITLFRSDGNPKCPTPRVAPTWATRAGETPPPLPLPSSLPFTAPP